MKKQIAIFLFLSLLTVACSSSQTEAETEVVSPSPTEEVEQEQQESTATVKLVSPDPQAAIPMGDAEMILEVVDSTTGEPVTVENLDVSSTMPMDGMEDMVGKVEVQPEGEPGRFKAMTHFGMQGTWNVVAAVKDPQYQAQQEFTFEVK